MARGRMINTSICLDKRVNDLSDDTSRLAFTWLIPFADREGRTHGDPDAVLSMVFPRRRNEITVDVMEGYIREWAACGLVYWYRAEGDMWIQFPGFERNQNGLRKDREPVSAIPDPATGTPVIQDDAIKTPNEDINTPEIAPTRRDDCAVTAALMAQKRKEEKRKEEKASLPPVGGDTETDYEADGVKALINSVGLITSPHQSEDVKDMLHELHDRGFDDWWYTSIAIAEEAEARSWDYIRKILNNHLRDGTPPKLRRSNVPAKVKLKKEVVNVVDPGTGLVIKRESTV